MQGYYVIHDSYECKINRNESGIMKKIHGQIKAMNRAGLPCVLYEIPHPRLSLPALFFSYCFGDEFKADKGYLAQADFLYIRRFSPVTCGFLRLLKYIKKHNPDCVIVYEIPTFPYDNEHRSKIVVLIDRVFRIRLKSYIDRITLIGSDMDEIFGIKVIPQQNGISAEEYPISRRWSDKTDDQINLGMAACYTNSHGLERVIAGLKKYYSDPGKSNKKYNIFLHIAGPENDTLKKYIKRISDAGIEDYVIYYGALYGQKLDDFFEIIDIGLCPLAMHRAGKVAFSSALKSREYMARGIPMVTSTPIDILRDDCNFCLKIAEDDTPVDMVEIIRFFERISKANEKSDISMDIHRYAIEHCSINNTMKSVIKYFKSVIISCHT